MVNIDTIKTSTPTMLSDIVIVERQLESENKVFSTSTDLII